MTALPKHCFSSPCSFYIGIFISTVQKRKRELGERVGITKGTVSKIFSEKDENGDPAYKELHIMWEILGSKAQTLKYGMKHLQNKQKGR